MKDKPEVYFLGLVNGSLKLSQIKQERKIMKELFSSKIKLPPKNKK